MTDLVFFYGTLMSGFQRPGRARLDQVLEPVGRGWIRAALFDLGIYPAAIPADDGRVWGEVHQMVDTDAVLNSLDEIEGFSAGEPDSSLYTRTETSTFPDSHVAEPGVFHQCALGRAQRTSGDYLQHLKKVKLPGVSATPVPDSRLRFAERPSHPAPSGPPQGRRPISTPGFPDHSGHLRTASEAL